MSRTAPLAVTDIEVLIPVNKSSKELAIAAIKEITTQMVPNAADLSKFTLSNTSDITSWKDRLKNAATQATTALAEAKTALTIAEAELKRAKDAYDEKYKTTDRFTRTVSDSKEHTRYLAAIDNKQRAQVYFDQARDAKEKADTAATAQAKADQSTQGGKKSSKNKVSRVKSTT
jgi:hypothetical protein